MYNTFGRAQIFVNIGSSVLSLDNIGPLSHSLRGEVTRKSLLDACPIETSDSFNVRYNERPNIGHPKSRFIWISVFIVSVYQMFPSF